VNGPRRVLLLTGGFTLPILLLAGGVLFARATKGGSDRMAPGLTGLTQPLSADPFVNAKDSTLDDAEAALGGHIVRPDTDLASDTTIEYIWLDSLNHRVALYYRSGVLLMVGPAADSDSDPSQVLANAEDVVAAGYGAAVLIQVDGVTAVATEQNFAGNDQCGTPEAECMPPQNNPSAITMILGDRSVELLAHIPLSDLTKIADSIE